MKSNLSQEKATKILTILEERFEANMNRHAAIQRSDIKSKLIRKPSILATLLKMEETEGEPDVIGYENEQYIFADCSLESPKGRRSYCYDREALESRKKDKPLNSILDVAARIGIDLMTEEEYRYLQTLGKFDLKTSSWIQTPDNIRKLGGALFCDRRYNTVFTYHNGADSYYSSRGFRGVLRV